MRVRSLLCMPDRSFGNPIPQPGTAGIDYCRDQPLSMQEVTQTPFVRLTDGADLGVLIGLGDGNQVSVENIWLSKQVASVKAEPSSASADLSSPPPLPFLSAYVVQSSHYSPLGRLTIPTRSSHSQIIRSTIDLPDAHPVHTRISSLIHPGRPSLDTF